MTRMEDGTRTIVRQKIERFILKQLSHTAWLHVLRREVCEFARHYHECTIWAPSIEECQYLVVAVVWVDDADPCVDEVRIHAPEWCAQNVTDW